MQRLFAFQASNLRAVEQPEGTYDAQQQLWVGNKETIALFIASCSNISCDDAKNQCARVGGAPHPRCYQQADKWCITCFIP